MDTSPDYFHSSYGEDTAEIRRTLQPIEQVLRVFEDHFDGSIRGWPYSVSPAKANAKQDFSNSTNAMISFALLAATGSSRNSALLPATRRVHVPGLLDVERRARLRKLVIRSLDTVSKRLSKPAGKIRLISNTFGVNDPFTITWLVEVHSILRTSPDGVAFLSRTNRLKALVREVFRRVQGPEEVRVLDFPADHSVPPATNPFEVSHPFPLLRVAHLRE